MKESNTLKALPVSKTKEKGIDDRVNKNTPLPSGRASEPPQGYAMENRYSTVTPNYLREIIPVMRNLMMQNADVGQAIHNIVTLGNTGHKIFFDRKRTSDEVDAMRNHLTNKRLSWASGQAGMDGIINRLIAQTLVGGAMSAEWVPNSDLTGIESIIFVNPEDIDFKLSTRGTKYIAYQRSKGMGRKKSKFGLIKLNPNTYRYFALNGDGEVPYGFPPYMSVLPRVDTQQKMDKNINFVVDEWGLLGFIEALITKPDQFDEKDEDYDKKLNNLLTTAKKRIMEGVKEGVIVGFVDDHEFKFNTASKSYTEAVELYNNNELMTASALKQDASLWGRAYSTSETQITVVFVKMLSELKNIHLHLKSMLEFGYALELRLAGYNFDSIEVRFNRSTIQDDLKFQQAEEIKIRNTKDKMILGIISQDQAADELGYEVSAEKEPMVPWEVLAGVAPPKPDAGLATDGTKKKADTKKKKTASDKKKRNDKKAVPK